MKLQHEREQPRVTLYCILAPLCNGYQVVIELFLFEFLPGVLEYQDEGNFARAWWYIYTF